MLAIDNRAGSKDLLKPLLKMGLPAELMRLDSGDVAFIGRGAGGAPVHVGVEYKKLQELVQSLRTNRLNGQDGQAEKMQKAFDVRYLLIEGELRYDRDQLLLRKGRRGRWVPMEGRMTRTELRKRLESLLIGRGLIWRWANDQADTCHQLFCIYRSWTDADADAHDSLQTIYRPPTIAPISEFRVFIQSFKGLEFEKSKAIEAHFEGNLKRAILAPKSEWMKIDGIGTKLAQHIEDVIEGRKHDR